MKRPAGTEIVHASAVAVGSAGLLLIGKSGSGKSTLAVELVALGAALVADDRVLLHAKDEGVLMSSPPGISGRIEAHGMGILRTRSVEAWLTTAVDLDAKAHGRLPTPREKVIAGRPIRLIERVETPAFASMLYVMMTGGLE